MSSFEADERQIRHFLAKTETLIRAANLEILASCLPEVDDEVVMTFARAVARLRGRYMEAVFALAKDTSDTPPPDQAVARVRAYRTVYEEARHGFDELTRAIERGYINVKHD